MPYTSIFRHKHPQTNKHNRIAKSILGFLSLVLILPSPVFAFDYTLPTPTTTALTSLDLFQAKYSESTPRTAAVVAVASPVTEEASKKATPTPKKVAAATPVKKQVPTLDSPVILEGEASYYSRAGCLGCDPMMIMANGQPLDDNALTMAIGADKKHLVGYSAKVTSLATGKSVIVRITDTGGFYQAKYGHRVADLTIATKQAIGMNGGVGQVRVEVLN